MDLIRTQIIAIFLLAGKGQMRPWFGSVPEVNGFRFWGGLANPLRWRLPKDSNMCHARFTVEKMVSGCTTIVTKAAVASAIVAVLFLTDSLCSCG